MTFLIIKQIQLKNPSGITSPPPFYTKLPNRLHMTRFKLFPKRQQFHQRKIIIELPHCIPHQYNTQLYSSTQLTIQLHMTISLITSLSLMTLTALSKYIPKQINFFLHHLFKLKSFCFHYCYRTLACQL